MTSIPNPATAALPATPTLIQRYAALMMKLMGLVAGRYLVDRTEAKLARMNDSQGRLASLSRRLRDLLERIEAGTVIAPRAREKTEGAPARKAAALVKPAMGRGFGWLIRQEGPNHHEVIWARDNMDRLLNEPQTLEKLQKAPVQAGRIVRPLCHMLMLQAPETLRLPPRPRRVRVRKPRVAKEVWKMPWGTPRVASADWPRGCVLPGETVPLRKRNRRRSRRQE